MMMEGTKVTIKVTRAKHGVVGIECTVMADSATAALKEIKKLHKSGYADVTQVKLEPED